MLLWKLEQQMGFLFHCTHPSHPLLCPLLAGDPPRTAGCICLNSPACSDFTNMDEREWMADIHINLLNDAPFNNSFFLQEQCF
ncbi:hypothetical protein Y1Q_0003824 [Alligator mississippiensis]|uniref:Uncharacterized protein n=1 Tax=Alligator mississippiensis TaxID=8496 RepID=A0A151MNF6_ALLMI|nr:hypothetical protein Y1Q_0003824 [Alligator mississippiensis]